MKLKLLSTAAAVALFSTGLMAQSQLDIVTEHDANNTTAVDTTIEAFTIAKEVIAGAAKSVDLNQTNVDRSLIYVPDIALAQGATIEITMTNGAIKKTSGNTIYLADGNSSQEVGKMTDFTVNADDTGYTWMRFQITDPDGLVSGDSVYFAKTKDGALASGQISVIVNKGLSAGAEVTAQVTRAKDDNGNDQNSPKTASESIAKVVDGITVSINPVDAVSTINVNKDRMKFLETTGKSPANDTLVKSYTAKLDVNTSAADVGLSLTGSDTFDLNISGTDCSGITAMRAVNSNLAPDTNGTCWFDFQGNFGAGLGAKLKSDSSTHGDYFEFTVDGDTILNPQDWVANMVIKADEVTPADTELKVLNNSTILTWKLNGEQFIVPYLNTSAAYGTYLVVTNSSAKDAPMTMDVYADKGQKLGQAQSALVCQNVTVGTVPAHSTATFYPADFNNAIDGTSGCANFSTTNDRFMGKFSLVAPTDTIHAAAFQKDGANGKRSIPVLTSADHTWKE